VGWVGVLKTFNWWLMASLDGPPPPVSNPITGTWRNSFADKDQKGRDLQKFDGVEELICDLKTNAFVASIILQILINSTICANFNVTMKFIAIVLYLLPNRHFV
jgi:hypothetical protein